ncbi:hypothetical protein [Megasphaera cerevisiae]|uniref:hypothetical protein n=1 Tax=Megasphaera cerevisiae TaxID=39029 RepID=UPI0009FA9F6F|nr:hypothetical protein [Megasphaera cerevisiae]
MKKMLFLFLLCFVFIMSLFINCFAQEASGENQDMIQEWLAPAEGDWYSTKGTLTMSIQDGSINGCKVLEAQGCTYDYPRTGTFQIAEADGKRNLKMNLFGNDVHQYLMIDDKMILRRSIHPEYNESVDGIYLGMTQADFLLHNTKAVRTIQEGDTERWEYDDTSFAVIFKGNMVVAIRLYKGSSRHFTVSGLGAGDTPDAYAKAYGMNEVPVIPTETDTISSPYKIGHGEKLFFNASYIELSV